MITDVTETQEKKIRTGPPTWETLRVHRPRPTEQTNDISVVCVNFGGQGRIIASYLSISHVFGYV